jgi:hypothetical protein
MLTSVSTSFGRGRQRAGSGHASGCRRRGESLRTTHERSPARLDVADPQGSAPLDPGQTQSATEARFRGVAADDGRAARDESTLPGTTDLPHRFGGVGRSKRPEHRQPDHVSGSAPLLREPGKRHLLSGCSSGSTASSDTAFQGTALLGWHDRLRLSGRAGPGVHPHRWDPSGNRRVGEVATESTQEAKARRGRTPPAHRRKRDREGRGGQRSWRQRRQGQDGMRGRPTTRSPLACASEHHLGDAPGAGP